MDNPETKPRSLGSHRSAARARWPWLAVLLTTYLLLLLPTLSRQGISWDEAVDLEIARTYATAANGWIRGSVRALDQARLPMATVAFVFELADRTDLLVGRFVSVLVGALTLLGTYCYGRRRLGPTPALFACSLLVASPFFLAFARVAFTETDIYLACALVWLLYFLDRLEELPSLGRAAPAAILFGLAAASKFTALVVLPILAASIFRARNRQTSIDAGSSPQLILCTIGMLSSLAAGRALVGFAGDILPSNRLRSVQVALASVAWLATGLWVLHHRRRTSAWPRLAGFATTFGLLTLLLAPPEHLTNGGISRTLLEKASNQSSFDPAYILESLSLYFLSILLKSSPVFGFVLLVSLALTFQRWRSTKLDLALLLLLIYLGGLLTLPFSQTFYVVPLLPVLSLFSAEQFDRLARRHRSWALSIAALGAFSAGLDIVRCYPDFHLSGYQYVGARPLAGRSSIGYRSVVQTPCDGVEQSLRWLSENARPGDRVTTFISCWHIVQATVPNPHFEIANGLQTQAHECSDFVITHINDQIHQGWGPNDTPVDTVHRTPYDPQWLQTEYEEVFRVPRAFGINVASVWRRHRDRPCGNLLDPGAGGEPLAAIDGPGLPRTSSEKPPVDDRPQSIATAEASQRDLAATVSSPPDVGIAARDLPSP